MSGGISISASEFWHVGTWAVDAIAASIHRALPSERDFVKSAYEPLEIFRFVSLERLTVEDYRCFLVAARQQLAACEASGECEGIRGARYEGLMECWRELIGLLESDPRAPH
jgi:hypothetical protein